MDAKLRSTWTTKAAQAGYAPAASAPIGPIAAMPVLPSLFSTAAAETRRAEAESSDAGTAASDPFGNAAGQAAAGPPVLPTPQGAPTLPSDPANAAVRVSDLSAARTDGDQDGPACRVGDRVSSDGAQAPTTSADGQDRSSAGERAPQDQGAPLPHCSIEFDPDADDPDVIAQAPKASTTPTKAAAAQAAATIEAAAKQADKVPEADAAQAEAQAASETDETAAAIAVATSTSPATSDTTLLAGDAGSGLASAASDPSLPTDSAVLAADLAPIAQADTAAIPTPDMFAQALSMPGTLAMPGAILQPDPLFDHLLIG